MRRAISWLSSLSRPRARFDSVRLVFLVAALTAVGSAPGCSAHRDERLSQRLACTMDSECGEGRCIDGFCTTPDSVLGAFRATIRVDGAPVVIEHEVVGDEVCTDSKQQTVCTLAPGAKVIWRAPLADGYRFTGWTGDPGCTSSVRTLELAVAKDIACVAHYVRRLKVAGGIADGYGSVSASSESAFATCKDGVCEVDQGAEVKLTAPARDGYRLESWTGEGCSGSTSTIGVTPISSNITCSAVYVMSLTVRGSALGNGDKPVLVVASSSSPNARCDASLCAVEPAAEVTLTAPNVEGLRFAGWSGDAVCTGSEPTLKVGNVLTNVSCMASYVARYSVRGSSQGASPGAVIVASSADAFASCAGDKCAVDDGGSVVLTAPSVRGYRLSGWTGEGCGSINGASVTVSDVHQERSCVATYVAGVAVLGTVVNADATVQASSASPGANCAPGFCVIDTGGTVTLTAPSLPGRTFLGWEGDEGCAGQSLAITLSNVSVSRSCSARYAARYLVEGDSLPVAGGAVSASSSADNVRCEGARCTVDEGSTAALRAVAAPGFRFAGWSGGGACTGGAELLTLQNVRSNITCGANFVARFEVRGEVVPQGAGTTLVSSASTAADCNGDVCLVDAGANASLLATASLGFRFTGWEGCAASSDNPLLLSNLSSSVRCSARFERIVFEVLGEAGVGGTVAGKLDGPNGPDCTDARCVVGYGDSVAFRAQPGAGYTFAGWSGCSTSTAAELQLDNVMANALCRATFTRVRVTVAAVGMEGGVVSASSNGAPCADARCTVDYGGSVSVNATPATGYRFVGWSECGDSSEATLTLDNVTSNRSCVATFTRLQFTVRSSVSPVDSGDVGCSSTGCGVAYGGSVTLNALPRAGFSFSRWSDCSASTVNPLPLANVTSDLSCVANFERIRVGVSSSVTPPNTGSVTCSVPGCTVDYGGMLSLSAIPVSARYRFVGWSDCSTSTNPTLVLANLTAARNCVANFALVQHTVRASVATSGGGTVDCANGCVVNDGESLVVNAQPAIGFNFAAWSCTPAVVSTGAALALNGITQDYSCVATFRPEPPPVYTVTINRDGTSTPSGLYAGAACPNNVCSNVAAGGSVTLVATLPANSRYVLTGWGSCAVDSTQLSYENGSYVYRSSLGNVRANQSCTAQLTPGSSITLVADLAAGGTPSMSVPIGSGFCTTGQGAPQCLALPATRATLRARINSAYAFQSFLCRGLGVDGTTITPNGVEASATAGALPADSAINCTVRINPITNTANIAP